MHYNWSKVSIIGHSLGGAAGFLYAAIYPNDIEKLISIDIVCPRVARTEFIIKQVEDCIDKYVLLLICHSFINYSGISRGAHTRAYAPQTWFFYYGFYVYNFISWLLCL